MIVRGKATTSLGYLYLESEVINGYINAFDEVANKRKRVKRS